MHEYITAGLPVFAVFLAVLLNQRGLERFEGRIDSRIDRLEAKMETRFDGLQRDLREFDRTIGQHDARLDALEAKRTA